MATPEFQALTDEVANDTTVMGSATTLIDGFAQRLADAAASANPAAAITQLQSDLSTSRTALVAAVVANTPAAATAA
jgi:hypothetical protein